MRNNTKLALRAFTTIGLFAVLASILEPTAVLERAQDFNAAWLIAGFALCALQIFASAERWRLTAQALGVPISRRRAIADYYLAGLANQVLPGGIIGDAARATRHAHSSGQTGLAVRAVVLERASGQIVLLIATALLLIATPTGRTIGQTIVWTIGQSINRTVGAELAAALAVLALVCVLILALFLWCRPQWLQLLIDDARRALCSLRLGLTHLALSLVVFGALCGTFVCAGRMLGVEVGSSELFILAPLVLLSMLIPISVGGWGVRESAAAGLFALSGYAPETGVLVSIAYGLITLAATSPGALVPLIDSRTPPHRSSARRSISNSVS